MTTTKRRASAPVDPLDAITEKQFTGQVVKALRLGGWTAYHTWNSFHSTAGFPDVCAVHPSGRLLFAELKTTKASRSKNGGLTPDQDRWLLLLRAVPGTIVRVWSPYDWKDIEAVAMLRAAS